MTSRGQDIDGSVGAPTQPDPAAPVEDSTYWDSRYRRPGHVFAETPVSILTSRVEALPPGRAVDLGCGTGRHARWLAERGWDVQACDFSTVAIAAARARAATHTIRYEVADARQWLPDGAVDLVLVGYLQLPVADLVTVLSRTCGWLTGGGRLIYLGHAREGLGHGHGGPQDPAILPTLLDLAGVTAGLRVNTLSHVIRPGGKSVDLLLDCERWQAPFAAGATSTCSP